MLDGETLTLPTDLAQSAGFVSTAPDSLFYTDNPRPEGTVPPMIANNMGVNTRGDFTAPAPENQFATLQRIMLAGGGGGTAPVMRSQASPAMVAATMGMPTSGGLPPMRNDDVAKRNASLQSAGIDPNSITPTDSGPTVSATDPHPMLSDPRFINQYRQDPTTATKFYRSTTGRDLASDIKLQASQAQDLQETTKGILKGVSGSLKFDPITGQPYKMVQKVTPPLTGNNMTSSPQVDMSREELSDPELNAINSPEFKKTFGYEKPRGIPAPNGLDEEEAAGFRLQVKAAYDADPSPASPQKMTRVYRDTWKKMWDTQNQAASTMANPAVAGANPPSLFPKLLSKSHNFLATRYNAVRDPIVEAAQQNPITSGFNLPHAEMWGAQDVINKFDWQHAGDFSGVPIMHPRQ